MSEPLRGVVISHGDLASALVDAVRRITGDAQALQAVSNEGCDRDDLLERVTEAVGDGPAVVFVDLPSGSCLQAAVRYLHGHDNVAVVAGVNLAMVLDFIHHRDARPQQAADRAVATGGDAIRALRE